MQDHVYSIIGSEFHIQKEKFSKNLTLCTYYHTVVKYVFGAIPANFSEFSFVLVSFIEIGGITAIFIKCKPKQAQFRLKSLCIAEFVPF